MIRKKDKVLLQLNKYLRENKSVIVVIIFVLLSFVSLIDFLTGYEIAVSLFYLLPISVATWYFGFNTGLGISIICALIWMFFDSDFGAHVYQNHSAPYWNMFVRFGFFFLFSLALSELKKTYKIITEKSKELIGAYSDLDRISNEKISLKDQILSYVSHELKTPLTAIHQFTTILLDGIAGDITAEQKEYLNIIFRNINQLNQMIGDLLDTTRIDAGKLRFEPGPVSIKPILDEIKRILISPLSEKRITFSDGIPEDLPRLYTDPDRLRQVLINLIDNAMKFTPPGGNITVNAEKYDTDPLFVKISVIDTGKGISLEAKEKLFQRLYQESQSGDDGRKGLGLGLFIIKQIIEKNNGKIWVNSVPGKGSSFFFTVPIYTHEMIDSNVSDQDIQRR